MTQTIRPIREQHTVDIAWIIELWRAIHGGDPPPQPAAREILTGVLVTQLSRTIRDGALASQLLKTGNMIIESGVREIARSGHVD